MANRYRVLIPNDFLSSSLVDVVQVIEDSKAEELDIVLAFGKTSSTSITELLGVTADDMFNDLQSDCFIKACQVLIHHFSDRKLSIFTDFITSKSQNYLCNYVKGNCIDEVVVPVNYIFMKRTSNHFDLCPLLSQLSGVKVNNKVVSARGNNGEEERNMSGIFFKNYTYAKT